MLIIFYLGTIHNFVKIELFFYYDNTFVCDFIDNWKIIFLFLQNQHIPPRQGR